MPTLKTKGEFSVVTDMTCALFDTIGEKIIETEESSAFLTLSELGAKR